jgi:hypothetical protein
MLPRFSCVRKSFSVASDSAARRTASQRSARALGAQNAPPRKKDREPETMPELALQLSAAAGFDTSFGHEPFAKVTRLAASTLDDLPFL